VKWFEIGYQLSSLVFNGAILYHYHICVRSVCSVWMEDYLMISTPKMWWLTDNINKNKPLLSCCWWCSTSITETIITLAIRQFSFRASTEWGHIRGHHEHLVVDEVQFFASCTIHYNTCNSLGWYFNPVNWHE